MGLLGWASVQTDVRTGHGGSSSEYHIAEIDKQGNLQSKPQLLNVGWGEDNVWAPMPVTGCVARAFTWNKDLSHKYGNSYRGGDAMPGTEEFSDILRLTVVCPK